MIQFIKNWWNGYPEAIVEKEAHDDDSDVSEADPNYSNRAIFQPDQSLKRAPSSQLAIRIDGSGLANPRPGTI